jgi:hypothetical protein
VNFTVCSKIFSNSMQHKVQFGNQHGTIDRIKPHGVVAGEVVARWEEVVGAGSSGKESGV